MIFNVETQPRKSRKMKGRSRRRWGTRKPSATIGGNRSNSSSSQFDTESLGARGRRFEKEVANKLESFGWDVSLTSATGDYGCDVLARCGENLLVVQCKDWVHGVGFDAIKEIHAARAIHAATHAAVIIRGRFTAQARSAANQLDINLLHIDQLGQGHALDRSREGALAREVRAMAELQRIQCEQATVWENFDAQLKLFQRRKVWKAWLFAGMLLGGSLVFWAIVTMWKSHTVWMIVLLLAVGALFGFVKEKFDAIKPPTASVFPRPSTEKAERKIIPCLNCKTLMRLPLGRAGTVNCPECRRNDWYLT